MKVFFLKVGFLNTKTRKSLFFSELYFIYKFDSHHMYFIMDNYDYSCSLVISIILLCLIIDSNLFSFLLGFFRML